jgi:hypothetical protein
MSDAATRFAESVRARHEILEGLFLAVYAGAARASICFSQRCSLPQEESLPADDPTLTVIQGLKDSQSIAEATAQDAACALMLITDYAIRRYGREAKAENPAFTDTRDVGAPFRNGVTFNKAVWSFANQARHFDKWIELGHAGCAANPSYETIRLIEYDPMRLNAAREFIAGAKGLNLKSYAEYESLVLKCVPTTIATQSGVRVLP